MTNTQPSNHSANNAPEPVQPPRWTLPSAQRSSFPVPRLSSSSDTCKISRTFPPNISAKPHGNSV